MSNKDELESLFRSYHEARFSKEMRAVQALVTNPLCGLKPEEIWRLDKKRRQNRITDTDEYLQLVKRTSKRTKRILDDIEQMYAIDDVDRCRTTIRRIANSDELEKAMEISEFSQQAAGDHEAVRCDTFDARKEETIEAEHPHVMVVDRGNLRNTKGLIPENREFSVTEIEQYLECPYKWFFNRRLRPQRIDTGFGPIERGNILHGALDGFYSMLAAQNGALAGLSEKRVTDKNIAAARKMASTCVDDYIEKHAHSEHVIPKDGADRCLIERCKDILENYLERDSYLLPGYEPTYSEFAFGERADLPVSYAGVSVKGKIDRIDIDQKNGRMVVVDYKSSDVRKYHLHRSDGKIVLSPYVQGAIYAHIASNLLDLKPVGSIYRSLVTDDEGGAWDAMVFGDGNAYGLKSANALYPDEVNLSDGSGTGNDQNGDECTGSVFESYLSQIEDDISERLERLRAGDIAPDPHPLAQNPCGYCMASPICKKNQGGYSERCSGGNGDNDTHPELLYEVSGRNWILFERAYEKAVKQARNDSTYADVLCNVPVAVLHSDVRRAVAEEPDECHGEQDERQTYSGCVRWIASTVRDIVGTEAVGNMGFYKYQPTVVLTLLLRATANPLDEEALLLTLASPLFGLDDDDLLTLRTTREWLAEEPSSGNGSTRGTGGGTYYEALKRVARISDGFRSVYYKFTKLVNYTVQRNYRTLFVTALEESGWSALDESDTATVERYLTLVADIEKMPDVSYLELSYRLQCAIDWCE